MTDLPYLASRLYGTPLLIARPKLEVILGVVARKLAGDTLATPPGGFRLLGVRVEGLSGAEDGVQLLLDDDPRRGAPERAADAVRRRWGEGAVRPASLIRGREGFPPEGQDGLS